MQTVEDEWRMANMTVTSARRDNSEFSTDREGEREITFFMVFS